MNKEVLNLIEIYTKESKELQKALAFKYNWLNKKFIIEGNLDFTFDNNGLKHYDFIESLYDGIILLKKPRIEEEYFTSDEIEYIKFFTEDLLVLELYDEIPKISKDNFFIELDFTKLELSEYNSLFANFYRTIEFKDLNINLKKPDFYEVIKCLIIRKRLQNLIILTKNQYIDNKIYLPIISKIYINNKTSRKLVETLKEISNKFKVEVINYEDNNF